MAKKFVRNITGTKIKGEHQEPLWTNMQNDLLSDDEDVAVRNKKEYHLLTDNLKTHLVKTNAFMSISEKEKNGLKLNVLQASETEVKNAVDTPRVINPKQTKDMIEQRTPKIVRDIIETDVPQSDWNETDPNSKAFIRNKPDFENGGGGGNVDLTEYIKGKNIQAMPGMNGISVTHASSPDTSVGLSLNFANQKESETGNETYKPMNSKGVKQAIDKQVPLIVAEQATSIIEKNFEELPHPDWNETNQESHGFIKNKPDVISKVKYQVDTPLQLEKKGNELVSSYSDINSVNFIKVTSQVSLSNREELSINGLVGLTNYYNLDNIISMMVGLYIPKHDKVIDITMSRRRGGVQPLQDEFYNSIVNSSRVGVQENVSKEKRFEFYVPTLLTVKDEKVKESLKQLVEYLHEIVELNDDILQPSTVEVHVKLFFSNNQMKNINTNMIINRDK